MPIVFQCRPIGSRDYTANVAVRPDQHRFAFGEALERREINSDIGDIATAAGVMDMKACPDWWACLI